MPTAELHIWILVNGSLNRKVKKSSNNTVIAQVRTLCSEEAVLFWNHLIVFLLWVFTSVIMNGIMWNGLNHISSTNVIIGFKVWSLVDSGRISKIKLQITCFLMVQVFISSEINYFVNVWPLLLASWVCSFGFTFFLVGLEDVRDPTSPWISLYFLLCRTHPVLFRYLGFHTDAFVLIQHDQVSLV